jgi:hypothetical protein
MQTQNKQILIKANDLWGSSVYFSPRDLAEMFESGSMSANAYKLVTYLSRYFSSETGRSRQYKMITYKDLQEHFKLTRKPVRQLIEEVQKLNVFLWEKIEDAKETYFAFYLPTETNKSFFEKIKAGDIKSFIKKSLGRIENNVVELIKKSHLSCNKSPSTLEQISQHPVTNLPASCNKSPSIENLDIVDNKGVNTISEIHQEYSSKEYSSKESSVKEENSTGNYNKNCNQKKLKTEEKMTDDFLKIFKNKEEEESKDMSINSNENKNNLDQKNNNSSTKNYITNNQTSHSTTKEINNTKLEEEKAPEIKVSPPAIVNNLLIDDNFLDNLTESQEQVKQRLLEMKVDFKYVKKEDLEKVLELSENFVKEMAMKIEVQHAAGKIKGNKASYFFKSLSNSLLDGSYKLFLEKQEKQFEITEHELIIDKLQNFMYQNRLIHTRSNRKNDDIVNGFREWMQFHYSNDELRYKLHEFFNYKIHNIKEVFDKLIKNQLSTAISYISAIKNKDVYFWVQDTRLSENNQKEGVIKDELADAFSKLCRNLI